MLSKPKEIAYNLPSEIPLVSINHLDRYGHPISFGQTFTYNIHGELGYGAYAFVYKASLKKEDGTTEEVALKIRRYNLLDCVKKSFSDEYHLIKRAQTDNPSPYIIQAHGLFQYTVGEQSTLCFTIELHEQDLYKALIKSPASNPNRLPLNKIKSIAAKLFAALGHLKSRRVLHSDIKPQNILLSANEEIVLADFGLGKYIGQGEKVLTMCSAWYNSPECVMDLPMQGFAHDMWSVGCILVELFIGQPLFRVSERQPVLHLLMMMQILANDAKSRYSYTKAIAMLNPRCPAAFIESIQINTDGKIRIKIKPKCDVLYKDIQTMLKDTATVYREPDEINDFIDLIEKMLQFDPIERISPEEALNHPFVRETAIKLDIKIPEPETTTHETMPAAVVQPTHAPAPASSSTFTSVSDPTATVSPITELGKSLYDILPSYTNNTNESHHQYPYGLGM